ncbi:MAG: hypothetical protein ACRCZI_05850 [Cetobacterium sp.]
MSDWIEHDGKKYFEEGYWDLCKRGKEKAECERDEARAQAARYREVLESILPEFDGYTSRVDGAWECSSRGALAGFGPGPERLGKAHREGCGGGGAIEVVLSEVPAQSLAALTGPLESKISELQQALESDRISVIDGVNRLTEEIESRAWLATGARGCYEWDDARYQQEFADAAQAILKALEPLRRIGADLSNCPADAKRSLERMRAEAGRERALRELKSLIEDTKKFGHTVKIVASCDLWDFRIVTEMALLLRFLEQRADEIEREGK